MMPRLNAYWLTAAGLWALAIGLTFWNLATMEAVATARDQGERLRDELLFQRRNAARLEDARLKAATFTLPVDSAQLGFLTAQGRLEALGAVFGLEKFNVVPQVGQAAPDQWLLTVSFEGPLEGAARFLEALTAYPYLSVQRTRVKVDRDRPWSFTELHLVFQFRIRPPGETAGAALQTTRLPLATGGQTS